MLTPGNGLVLPMLRSCASCAWVRSPATPAIALRSAPRSAGGRRRKRFGATLRLRRPVARGARTPQAPEKVFCFYPPEKGGTRTIEVNSRVLSNGSSPRTGNTFRCVEPPMWGYRLIPTNRGEHILISCFRANINSGTQVFQCFSIEIHERRSLLLWIG